MRTHLNAATALLLTALMLTSLFAIQHTVPEETLQEEEPVEVQFTSGRSATTGSSS